MYVTYKLTFNSVAHISVTQIAIKHSSWAISPMKATCRKLLKDYKTSTWAAMVTKEVLQSLLHQLWKTSISPEHIAAGFRASGLYPINPRAIPPYKIAPSVAIITNGSQSSSVREIPLRTELRHFFAEWLQPSQEQDAPEPERARVKLHAEGEALITK